MGNRPSSTNIPGSLKNNSAITITSRSGSRQGYQRVANRPIMGGNKMRPMVPGQKINDIRSRFGDIKAYNAMRARSPMQGRMLRPSLPGSVSITKITKDPKKSEDDSGNKGESMSDDETQILDSDEEEVKDRNKTLPRETETRAEIKKTDSSDSKTNKTQIENKKNGNESTQEPQTPIVLTTDEKLPSEEALETKISEDRLSDYSSQQEASNENANSMRMEKKINLLKNYRHQRPVNRTQTESSLSQLERTASVLNKEGMPDFRKNLDDITQSYSPNGEEKTVKSKKKKSPNKPEGSESQAEKPVTMSHSVSSLLGSGGTVQQKTRKSDLGQNTAPVAPIENSRMARPMPHENIIPSMPMNIGHGLMTAGSPSPAGVDMTKGPPANVPHPVSAIPPNPMASPVQPYPGANPPPEYGQYPPGKYNRLSAALS